MALSVSGFPEPSRSPASAEPSTDEGYKHLMNSPRLRSLFGKKHDSRAIRPDIEEGSPAASPPPTPPIASHLPSFLEHTYMPPPEDYELPIHMPVPVETRAMISKRPQPLPPIPIPIQRRATASPVRIQPSLARLDIGAISKQHPPHLPKPPPTVVIQEWSSKSAIDLPITHARPLPQPPPPAAESSRHVNAVAGPSRLPHTQAPAKVGSSAGQHATTRARSHSRSRIQPQGKPVAMRYQALSVEEKSTSSAAASPGAGSSSADGATTVRPLPTLPAPTPVSAILRTAPVAGPSRYIPPAPRINRPRTSPGLAQVGRSVFDASRPIDLNASVLAPSRPIQLPQHKPQMRVPASTSTKAAARPRRERSADSYLGKPPVPRIQTNRPLQRTMPSPVVGARPMPVRAATLDLGTRGAALPKLSIQTAQRRSPVSPPSSGTASASKSSSSSASASATSKVDTHIPASTTVQEDDASELDVRAPLHSHPDYALTDDDSIAQPEPSPVAESPLEVYIDDMDMTSISRSPSPITYARPNSRGMVSDEDLDVPNTPTTRRQPRSYRNSYRRPQAASPLSRSPSPIFYARRKSLDRGDISPVEKRRTQPRSFHYDPAGPMAPKLSPPKSRPASPERRSRSRQRKGKKDKEKPTQSNSHSPRRKFRSTGSVPAPPSKTAYEPVLDISLPKKTQSISIPNSLKSRKRPGTGGSSTGSSHHSGGTGPGRLVNPFSSALPHRRVASAVSVAAPEGEFDPYHGASCGIGMLRAAELSNSSGISSSSAGSKREGRDKDKDKGRRHTQHEQRQRVNSTTAYEEFFSSLRRKEQKNQMKDDIALVDLGLRVDNEGGEEAVVLTAIQSNRDRWAAAAAEGMDSTAPRLRGLKTKF